MAPATRTCFVSDVVMATLTPDGYTLYLVALHRFVVVSVLSNRFHTSVQKKTVNPVYSPKDATFEFPLYLSLAEKLGVIELVIWDKDMLKKDYLGEVSIPLDSWFRSEDGFAFDHPNNEVSVQFGILARENARELHEMGA